MYMYMFMYMYSHMFMFMYMYICILYCIVLYCSVVVLYVYCIVLYCISIGHIQKSGFGKRHVLPPAARAMIHKVLPATFVVNNDGREACVCPLPEDADGLYVLFFSQGTVHGSKKIRTDAAQLGETVMLPVLFYPKNMSDAVLTTQMCRHMQAHNAVVVAVVCSKKSP